MERTPTTRKLAFDREVDVRGFTCPIPALRARAALERMKSGEVLRIVSTDPGATRDFRLLAEKTGHALLAERKQAGKELVFYLRKA